VLVPHAGPSVTVSGSSELLAVDSEIPANPCMLNGDKSHVIIPSIYLSLKLAHDMGIEVTRLDLNACFGELSVHHQKNRHIDL
jgi:hypothetical protein